MPESALPDPSTPRQSAEFRVATRARLLEEPLALYRQEQWALGEAAQLVIGQLEALFSTPADPQVWANVLGDPAQLQVLQALAAEPLSEGELEALVDGPCDASSVRADPRLAQRLADLLRPAMDPYRFPWLAQSRAPTHEERQRAAMATACLATVSLVQSRLGDI